LSALLGLLKGHPLSLVQAACSIREENLRVNDYIEDYKSASGIAIPTLHDYHRDAGFLSARMNLDHMRRIDINAVRLARLFAFFDRNNLNYDLLSIPIKDIFTRHQPKWLRDIASDKKEFDTLVRKLLRHAILMPCEGMEESFTMHSTVQALCQNDCMDIESEEYIRLAASMICSAIPRSSTPDQELVRYKLLPHAELLVEHLTRFEKKADGGLRDSTVLTYYHVLATLFDSVSRVEKALTLWEMCLKGRRDVLGTGHVDTLHTMFNLANFYNASRKLNTNDAAKAIELYQQCILGYPRVLDPNHQDVVHCYTNLGCLYTDLGRWTEAKGLYMQVLGLSEENQLLEAMQSRDTHQFDPDTVTNLGLVCWRLEEHAEAELLLRYALTKFSCTPGRKNEVASYDLLNNLGLLYRDIGRLTVAEGVTLESLNGKRKAWGEKHASTLRSKFNLGTIYAEQQKYTEAETVFLELLDAAHEVFDYDYPENVVVNSLGNLYIEMNHFADAEVMLIRSYKARKLQLGECHYKTADTANNLAVLYRKQKRFEDCENWIQITADAYKVAYGPESLQWASTLTLTALMKKAQVDIRGAALWYEQSIKAHVKAAGTDHIETLRVEYDLAVLYEDLGDFKNGYPHARRAVAGLRKTAGKGSKEVLDATWVLANIHMHAGKPREAVLLMKLVVQGFADLKGNGNGMTVAATKRLAQCTQALRKESRST
jgi:tetratricopeptide (TPR) repeat protein